MNARAHKGIKKIIDNVEDIEWCLSPGWSFGDHCRVKTLISKDANGSNDLSFGIGEMDPGDIHLLHHHTEDTEIYYVLSGTAKITLDDEEIQAKPGMAFYMPANVKHRIENNGKEKFVLLWVFDTPRDPYEDSTTVWDEGPYAGDENWDKKLKRASERED